MAKKNLPLFTVCHNNGWMVRDTVMALHGRFPDTRIVVVDEASTAPRTRATLRELGKLDNVEVHHHQLNVGPKRVRRYPRYWPARRHPFVLTDPDLDLTTLPSDTLDVLAAVARDQGLRCVGLALDISQHDDLLDGPYVDGMSIREWESRFWREPVNLDHIRPGLEAYRAPIDTTLAWYDYSRPKGNTIRIAGEYTVRHLPWHKSYLENLDPQDITDYFGRDLKFGTIAPLVNKFSRKHRQDRRAAS